MVIYFSGTGNSRYVAAELQKRLDAGELYELTGQRILQPQKQLLEATDKELILWVFPTYAWSVPPVVLRFIDKVKFRGAENARHYMVCTCGDDMGRADDRWRHHIGRRGWTPRGAFSVIAPNNYVCMKGFDVDSLELEKEKIAAIPTRLDEITAKIKRGFADGDLIRGDWAWLKTNIVNPGFLFYQTNPAPFRADPEKCISCGLCSRSCPMENITIAETKIAEKEAVPEKRDVAEKEANKEKKSDATADSPATKSLPKWGPACAMCLRCYHQCPTHAINYGKSTLGKGQYRCKL